ncbi:MAG: RHS repeat-associated core domain-containing protein [Spirochaetota bacterium]|nr:RHS repeat-associated core domain-containing protein [Spirochaetota bacterium]
MIDTLPPDTPSSFRAIPGNANVILSWSEDDDETESYELNYLNDDEEIPIEIDRDDGVVDEETEISFFEVDFSQQDVFGNFTLENGQEYSFSMTAIDRAGNESFTKEVEVIVGLAREEYNDEEGTYVEFGTAKMMIPADSLSDEIEEIRIYETVSEDMEGLSIYPIISPIYTFDALTSDGEVINHVDFEENYVCKLAYDEELIPEGFPEQNLGVYYFDTGWSRWFKVEDSIVDTENNQILFSANHFTEFSIQPTVIEDLSAQELAAIEFEPFTENTQHQELHVSQQGGGVSTSMTEFVLPGRNGMDLEIRRTYDTGTARGDAGGLSANMSVSLAEIISGEAVASIGKQLIEGSAVQLVNSVKEYFQNNGDFSYSVGQGWRLNFPYVRGANSGVLVRTSSGSFHDIKAMDLDKSRSVDLGGKRILWLECHEREDFTLRVVQTKDPVQFSTSISGYVNKAMNSWMTIESDLYEKNGRRYHFDALGRVMYIEDPNGNSIDFTYDSLLLDHIEDSMGRKVRFEYSEFTDFFCVPQIKRIYVEDDPLDREVVYDYMTGTPFNIDSPLPLLAGADDIGGRDYSYDYDSFFLFSGEVGVKINIVALIGDLFTGSAFSQVAGKFGLTSLTVHGSAQCFWTFALDSMEGYGVRDNEVSFEKKSLSYSEIDSADYLFGLIPTAIDLTVGMKQNIFATTLVREDKMTGQVLTDEFSYDYRYAGEKQFYVSTSSRNDGKMRQEYTYSLIDKRRKRFSTWSDYVTSIVSGFGFTQRPFYIEYLPMETEKKTYDVQSGALIETVVTRWNKGNLQPSMRNAVRESNNFLKNQYTYDNWGNVRQQIVTEKAASRTVEKTIYSVFAGTNSSPGSVSGWEDSPFEEPDLDESDIHDRLVRRLIKLEDEISGTRSINSAYRYDTKGNRTGESIYNDVKGWQITSYEVNDAGEVTKKTSPLSHVIDITYDYDSYDEYYVIAQTQNQVAQGDGSAIDIESRTIYDWYTGLPVWSTDGRGFTTYNEYDSIGRKTLIQLPDDDDSTEWEPMRNNSPDFRDNNPTTEIAYDDDAQTITVVNAEGATTRYTYHDLGKITEKLQINRYGPSGIAGGDVSFDKEQALRYSFGYDAHNNIVSVEDPRGNRTEYEYDAIGQLTREIYPLVDGVQYEKSYEYEYLSRKKTTTNENGEMVVEFRDSRGNVLKRLEYDGGLVSRTILFYFDANGNLVKEIDGRGGETVYTYNERDLETNRSMSQSEFRNEEGLYTASPRLDTEYNADGYKISETSYRGSRPCLTEYEVNGLGQIIGTTIHYTDLEGTGKTSVTKSVFDRGGNEIETIDPRGNTTSRAFSARRQLVRETDALGNTVSYAYDKLDRQITMTDQRGNSGNYPAGDFTVEYIYDDLDRLIMGKLPRHQDIDEKPEVKLVYDRRGNLEYRIEADGGMTSNIYDARNRLTSETRSAADSTDSYTTTMEYDGVGNIVKQTEAGAEAVEYEYDGLNRRTEERYADGGVKCWRYDENDNIIYEDHRNGYRSYYEYNAVNQRTKQTDALSAVSRYRYDEAGNLTWYKDEKGVERSSAYDEADRLIWEHNGRGGVSRYRYDAAGNLVEESDPRQTVITRTYGPTNLLENERYENGGETHTVSYRYDEGGVLKEVRDGSIVNRYNTINGSYTPDPYGLIHRDIMSGAGAEKSLVYEYDEKLRPSMIGLPSGETVEYEHNGLDQITAVPGYIEGAVSYDSNTYLASYTLANGLQLNRSYDGKRRLTDLTYTRGVEELEAYRLSYDLEDNIIKRNGDYFSYDGKNRLLSAGLAGEAAAMERDYEGEGQPMAAQPDILGEQQLLEVQGENLSLDWGARSLAIDLKYGYRVKKIILKAASPEETRVSEENLEVYTSLYNQAGSYTRVEGFRCERDEESGEITIELEGMSFARYIKIHSHFNEMTETGGYREGPSELTLDTEAPFAVKVLSAGRGEFYSYDGKDNRTQVSYMSEAFTTYRYSYYPGSDLVRSDGRYGYRYDENGNTIEKGSEYTESGEELEIEKAGEWWGYEYDLLNRLTAVYTWNEETESEELVKSYRYNGAGYRVAEVDREGQESYSLFDSEGKLAEKEEAGVVRDYIYLGSRIIAHVESGRTSYYGTDHLGSTALMSDESGEVVWRGEVTPFADEESTEGLAEHVMYTGKELDEATGLYYYNARWYDPELGRFITEDPARDGRNWYVYARNNPLKYIDPTGLFDSASGLIEEGDTLSDIAEIIKEENGIDISVEHLAEINQIEDPDIIEAGSYIENILPEGVFLSDVPTVYCNESNSDRRNLDKLKIATLPLKTDEIIRDTIAKKIDETTEKINRGELPETVSIGTVEIKFSTVVGLGEMGLGAGGIYSVPRPEKFPQLV